MIGKTQGKKIRKYFLDHNETIAVAESVTAGLLQLQFADRTDAAHFFQGGITTYNIGQKCRHLYVEPTHAQACNCVSNQVAEQMAKHVCDLFSSDWGIAITGYATPVPESDHKLFCHYAIYHGGIKKAAGKIDSKGMKPQKAQERYCEQVIEEFVNVLEHIK